MSNDTKNDPLVAFGFALEIQGVTIGMFKSVSGMETTVEVTEIRQTDMKGQTQLMKIPGQVKYGDVTFTRGFTKDNALHDWYQLILDGKYKDNIKTASVILYDQDHKESARWNLERCWPSVLKTNGFDAGGSEVVIEEMTFVVNHIERK